MIIAIGVVLAITLIILEVILIFVDPKSKKSNSSMHTQGGLLLAGTNSVADGIEQYVLYDPETNVMYTFIIRNGNPMGLTVMYNKDKTLKIYSPKK